MLTLQLYTHRPNFLKLKLNSFFVLGQSHPAGQSHPVLRYWPFTFLFISNVCNISSQHVDTTAACSKLHNSTCSIASYSSAAVEYDYKLTADYWGPNANGVNFCRHLEQLWAVQVQCPSKLSGCLSTCPSADHRVTIESPVAGEDAAALWFLTTLLQQVKSQLW